MPIKSSKKTVKTPAKVKPAKINSAKIKPIGAVTHYYTNLEVAIIKFNKSVKAGASVKFKGNSTDFEQTLDSMQYDHKNIAVAKKGQEIGVKVKDKVREGDKVYSA